MERTIKCGDLHKSMSRAQNRRLASPTMRPVVIAGVGSTPFGKLPGQDIVSLTVDACRAAIADTAIARDRVEAIYLGNFVGERLAGQGALASVVAGRLGLAGVPATKVEAACASGGIAVRHAYLSVAAGLHDCVLVAGVEKMSDMPTGEITAALSTAGDELAEMRTGLTFPGAFAMIMGEHMARYGTTREQIAMVSVKNHANGVTNPKAQFRKPTSVAQVLSSRPVAAPIRLFDCPPISDGAAAALICAQEIADGSAAPPIRILGSGQASGPAALTDVDDLTTFPATTAAARSAFETAQVGPTDVDVAEVHDCFTIAEIVATEDLGFFPKGEGGPAVESGATHVGGSIPINPSGGLISKGHPVGASGVGQIYELVQQLRGAAANQVGDARIGLAHNLGGSGAAATVHVLARA